MGIPSFSEWVKTKSGSYRPPADRAKAIRRGHTALQLGMTLERALSLMPEPDWAEDGLKGCTWHYATSLAADGESEQSLTVRFSGTVVNSLGNERLSVSVHSKSPQYR